MDINEKIEFKKEITGIEIELCQGYVIDTDKYPLPIKQFADKLDKLWDIPIIDMDCDEYGEYVVKMLSEALALRMFCNPASTENIKYLDGVIKVLKKLNNLVRSCMNSQPHQAKEPKTIIN